MALCRDMALSVSGKTEVGVQDLYEEDIVEYESYYLAQAMAEPSNGEPSPEESANVLGTTHIVGNRAFFIIDGKQLHVQGMGQEDEWDTPAVDAAEFDWGSPIAKYAIVDGKTVADQAYYRSQDLESVELAAGIREIGEFSYARSSLGSIVLPEGTEKIDYGAFYHCDNLESVTIPDTVMCVEPKAFSHSLWVDGFLEGAESDEAQGDFLVEGGVLVAYRGNADAVEIPGDVRVIAGEAFYGHNEIREVTLPDSLLVVGEGAFEACGGLERIVFGGNVEEIKDRAFRGTGLKEVSLPASVKRLGLMAFGDAEIIYEGEEPERGYETSATRMSNTSYRVYGTDGDGDGETQGVSVSGMEGASASLEGADRSYTLTVGQLGDISTLERVCIRSANVRLPEGIAAYDLTLTDGSGIPIIRLGQQILTVEIPMPESLRGQEVKVLTLDRNGQLEVLEAERVLVEEAEYLRFRTNQLTVFGLVGAGAAKEGEPMEPIED